MGAGEAWVQTDGALRIREGFLFVFVSRLNEGLGSVRAGRGAQRRFTQATQLRPGKAQVKRPVNACSVNARSTPGQRLFDQRTHPVAPEHERGGGAVGVVGGLVRAAGDGLAVLVQSQMVAACPRIRSGSGTDTGGGEERGRFSFAAASTQRNGRQHREAAQSERTSVKEK